MKLPTEQSTWELFASCEDQLKAECQLFHFKFHEEEKLQTHVPTHPLEFFSTLDRTQHVGVWKHFQSVALNIFFFCLMSKFHPPPMPQMEKYLRWKQNEQIWKLSLALGQSGGSPWLGGALPSSGGKFRRIPTLYGCTALYSSESGFYI